MTATRREIPSRRGGRGAATDDARAPRKLLAAAALLAVSAVFSGCPGELPPELIGPGSFDCDLGMEVAPAQAETEPGATVQFTARCGANLENAVTESATWSTSDTDVATVDDAGVATGVAEGETTITASEEGQEASATLRVTAPSGGSSDMDLWLTRSTGARAILEKFTIEFQGANASLTFREDRDVSGDGDGEPEFMEDIPKKGVVTPFPGSEELACYAFDDAAGIDFLGSVPTGALARWAGATEDFLLQSGDPPKAWSVDDGGGLTEISVPGGQGPFAGVSLYGGPQGQTLGLGLEPDGTLHTYEVDQGGLTLRASQQMWQSGGHVAVSPGGLFVSIADPAAQQLHVLETDADKIPGAVIETLENLSAHNAAFGGDPAWDNVCLAVADRTREEVRFFTVDKTTGDIQEASGSPLAVAVLGNVDVEGSFVALIGDVTLELREFTGSDCDTAQLDQVDTGGFNLSVKLAPSF